MVLGNRTYFEHTSIGEFLDVARMLHDWQFQLEEGFSEIASELGEQLVGSGGFEPPTAA